MDRRLAWQTALVTMLVVSSTTVAGCAALDLLGATLPGNEEDPEPLIDTQPYPPARRTVSEVPTAAEPATENSAETPAPVVSPAQTSQSPAKAASQSLARISLSDGSAAGAVIQPQPAAAEPTPPAPAAEAKPETAAATSPAETLGPSADAEPVASKPADNEAESVEVDSTEKAVEKEPTPQARLSDILRRRDELVAALEDDVKLRGDNPGDEAELLRLQQQLRLLYLLAERPDDAVSEITSLPDAEQEAFKQLMFGLNTWLSPEEERRPSLRNARVLRSFKQAAAELAAAAKLDVANLRFCENVEGFGWYKEFPTTQFRARQQVILYAEVDNFATEKKNADTYETELKVSYQIFDAGGTLVDERELPLDKEVCRNQRRDYFLAYRIYLPDGISAGRYRLELTVEDLKAKDRYQGRKLGTGLIDFSIRQ